MLRLICTILLLVTGISYPYSRNITICDNSTRSAIQEIYDNYQNNIGENSSRDYIESIIAKMTKDIIETIGNDITCKLSEIIDGKNPKTSPFGVKVSEVANTRNTLFEVSIDSIKICIGISLINPRIVINIEEKRPFVVEYLDQSELEWKYIRYAMKCSLWNGKDAEYLFY